MNDQNIALVELYKDAVVEQKKEKKRWFLFSIFSNLFWGLVVISMVVGFLIWDSQFEYETTETTTTVNQETGAAEKWLLFICKNFLKKFQKKGLLF